MPATASPERAMISVRARVTANERVRGGCQRLELDPGSAFPAARPGQFAMLSTHHPTFPLLPRPFSLLGCHGGRIEFLIMPVGVGSGLLCSLQPGEECQVVGPLGRSLDPEPAAKKVVCVGGGYGIAPFLFLLEHWERTADRRLVDACVVFGARSAERLSLAERVQRQRCRVELCTDDGSRGYHGRVGGRLAQILAEGGFDLVLTCGPEPMMEAVGACARLAGVGCRASLETVMGCGYAVCNGCAVAVHDTRQADGYTYELACREGTLFDEARLQWNLL